MDLGDRLRTLRKAAGISRSELARVVGLTPGAIRKIEESEVNGPGFESGLRLAAALRCWPDELLDLAFPVDLTFSAQGVLVEARFRLRGGEAARLDIIRAVRLALASVAEVEPDEHLAAVEAELAELHRRTGAALEAVARLKG